MKRAITAWLVPMLLTLLLAATALAGDWKKGDRLEVEWKGKWYKAQIVAEGDDASKTAGKYKIHYDGYETSWDEWVTEGRMRKLGANAKAAAWKARDSVQVLWKGSWYAATILEVQGDKYKIHYDGYESSWDEVVGADRVRAASAWKKGDAVDVKWKGAWYPAEILEVKGASFRIHYVGYESSWDEDVTRDRIRTRSK